jgi:hypothetical protein
VSGTGPQKVNRFNAAGVLAKFTGQSVPEVQETANLQVLSLQKSLFSSAAFWQRLAGQGE